MSAKLTSGHQVPPSEVAGSHSVTGNSGRLLLGLDICSIAGGLVWSGLGGMDGVFAFLYTIDMDFFRILFYFCCALTLDK